MSWNHIVTMAEQVKVATRVVATDRILSILVDELYSNRLSAGLGIGLSGLGRLSLGGERFLDALTFHLDGRLESDLKRWLPKAARALDIRLVGALGPGKLKARWVKDPRNKSRWRWLLEFSREGAWEVMSAQVEFLLVDRPLLTPWRLSPSLVGSPLPTWGLLPPFSHLLAEGLVRLLSTEGMAGGTLYDLLILRRNEAKFGVVRNAEMELLRQDLSPSVWKRMHRDLQRLSLDQALLELRRGLWVDSACSDELRLELSALLQEVGS